MPILNEIHFVKNILKKEFSIKKKNKICIAVSGGLDSMVLLHLFIKISNILSLSIEIAHCNFSLRKSESDQDEQFIKHLCYKKDILCHIKKFNILEYSKKNKLSIQMSARKLRYKWFDKLIQEKYYDYLALGHHLNDSIETFFINLIRGTGIKGLLGIPKKNKKIIRPLYSFTKEEIFNYAKKNKIIFRYDSSNQDQKYLRNKIRFIISSFSPSIYYYFYKGFKKSINFLYQENYLIEQNILKIKKQITSEQREYPFIWKINCNKVQQLSSIYLFKLFFQYGFSIKNIKQLCYAQTGKQLISNQYRIIKNRKELILIENEYFNLCKNKIYIITNFNVSNILLPIKIQFNIYREKIINIEKMITTNNILFIDFDKIELPLKLRTWRKGDIFYPLNMTGKKKLSKYYKDNKLSLLDKEKTWLLINGNNNIILVGNRLDNRFKITLKTQKILGIIL
ncbi:tRNA lysidine(34) synthetase TilS [Blattabacterium cuenoti]|uniref:tRNA lysidine(34) synthetase TilS n=1 Tax=Blattabacterium cuenoti TaxID=1653831 RepID=UPI00163B7792|nr:tRNA lysidine(34) synthetase TilS [Blattabacterium cuenoti]